MEKVVIDTSIGQFEVELYRLDFHIIITLLLVVVLTNCYMN